jgi:hypothetical protein
MKQFKVGETYVVTSEHHGYYSEGYSFTVTSYTENSSSVDFQNVGGEKPMFSGSILHELLNSGEVLPLSVVSSPLYKVMYGK